MVGGVILGWEGWVTGGVGVCFLMNSRTRAEIPGTFVEAHPLDAKTAKKIPRRMIGRTLTLDEAAALLDRLA